MSTQTPNTFIGKKLLDMLMFSMYPDAKIIYREYVQNAFDSIRKAVASNVLSRVKDGIVSITIDPRMRNVRIHDNGAGISVECALRVLTSIADSPKDGIEQAGVYGIGRLVGAGYCERLEFKTSAKGESKATIISFDVVRAREILDNKADHSSAAHVMNSIVNAYSIDEDIDNHYFEVILHNVKSDYPILLSEQDIVDYLREVAPIDYELPFKHNIMYPSLSPSERVSKLQRELPLIRLSVNDRLDIRKRYGSKVTGTGDEIVGLQYFLLDDPVYGELAWGWFAISKMSKAIPKADTNRCIRLRKFNIQVGERHYLNQFFDEARGNNYFYGEIHAIHPDLRPNTSRDGLTPTVESQIFFKKLKEYFKSLKVIYNIANKAKTAARDIANATAKMQLGGLSDEEKRLTQATLESGKKKLESVARSADNQGQGSITAAKRILEQYQNQINDTVGTTPTLPTVSETYTHAATADIFAPLAEKMSKTHVSIVRKVFKSLTNNCPKGQLQLIEDLKKLVIRDLGK